MWRIVLVAPGSALGGTLRYLISGWGQRLVHGAFPLGALIVNVIGCAVLGFLNKALADMLVPAEYRIALTVGALGGFTALSSYG